MAIRVVGTEEESKPPLPPPGTVMRGVCRSCKAVVECGPEDVVDRAWAWTPNDQRNHYGLPYYLARHTEPCLLVNVKEVGVIDLVVADPNQRGAK